MPGVEFGRKILVAEGDEAFRTVIGTYLKTLGIRAEGVGTLQEADSLITRESLGGIFLGLTFPDGDGTQLLKELQERDSKIPVAVISGGSDRVRDYCLRLGAQDVLQTPFDLDELKRVIGSFINYDGTRRST